MVKQIIPGGAADKEGHLKIEDKIVAVGEGETGEMVDVVDMKLNDVVKLIRGKPGTDRPPAGHSPCTAPNGRSSTSPARKIELKDSEARGEVFDAGRKAGRPAVSRSA